MGQLVCELCNGTEFSKQGDFFVCGSCGMKYPLEEARRMIMGDAAPAPVATPAPTSKPASSPATPSVSPIEKHLMNARRAVNKEDYEEAERYYNLVEQIAPRNIEAIFYSAYAKVMQLLLTSDRYKREAACKVLINCFPLIGENYQDGDISILIKLSNDLFKLIESKFVYTVATQAEEESLMSTAFLNMRKAFIAVLENIIRHANEDDATILHSIIIKHCLGTDALTETGSYEKSCAFMAKKDAKLKGMFQKKKDLENDLRILTKKLTTGLGKNMAVGCTPSFIGFIVVIIGLANLFSLDYYDSIVPPLLTILGGFCLMILSVVLLCIVKATANRAQNTAAEAIALDKSIAQLLDKYIATVRSAPTNKTIQ